MEGYKMDKKKVRKVNTKGCCFLCLESGEVKSKNNEDDKKVNRTPVLLQCLIRHLQINLKEINSGEDGSSLETGNDIEVDLCESCENLVKTFSSLFQQLEKIKKEMEFYLEQIHNTQLAAEADAKLAQEFMEKMESDSEALAELDFVEGLRNELAEKSIKLRTSPQPSVPVKRTIQVFVKQERDQKGNEEEHFEEDASSPVMEGSPLPAYSSDSDYLPSPPPPQPTKKIKTCSKTVSRGRKGRKLSKIVSHTKNGTGSYPCKACSKLFNNLTDLQRHFNAIHLKKKFKCEVCNVASFSLINNMYRHRKICRVKSKRWEQLKTNNSKKGKNVFECMKCDKPFQSFSEAQTHFETVHLGIKDLSSSAVQEVEKVSTEEEINSKCTRRLNNVYYTIDPVTGGYHCKKCDKTSKYQTTLEIHYETVHMFIQRRFKCDICKVAVFTQSCTLGRHKKTCREKLEKRLEREKDPIFKFICGTCGKRFDRKIKLENHEQSHVKFVCDLCGRKFKSMEQFETHKNEHSGEKFQCMFCDVQFTKKCLLEEHEKQCLDKTKVKIEVE